MTAVPLAGARCRGEQGEALTYCRCRGPGDAAETDPPAEGQKRFEIRMAAEGGEAKLDSEVLGFLSVKGPQERCFYVDLVAGGASKFLFRADATNPNDGVSPFLSIAEYGPAGPFWYDTLVVKCRGSYGRCDRQGADEWKASLANRRRGRLDPCGSAVVEALGWETSGGQAERDGGLFRDFSVGFQMDVKAFATRFEPGSIECVPK